MLYVYYTHDKDGLVFATVSAKVVRIGGIDN